MIFRKIFQNQLEIFLSIFKNVHLVSKDRKYHLDKGLFRYNNSNTV